MSNIGKIYVFMMVAFASYMYAVISFCNINTVINKHILTHMNCCGGNNTTCEVCTFLVDIVKYEMNITNDTITVIDEILDIICETLPIKPQKEECQVIVGDMYNITQWILNGTYPKDICEKLGFC